MTASLICAGGANAAITLYSSQSSFSAATSVAHIADFEGVSAGFVADPFTQDGINFHNRAGGALYLAPAHGAGTNPENSSQLLEANGDENFTISLSSGMSFDSIGLNFYSNAYGPAVISLFSLSGTLLGSFTNAQTPNSVAFVGFSSTIPIGYIQSQVDRGWLENTAVDDVQVGSHIGAVPELASWMMFIFGFGVAGMALRSQRRTVLA